MVDLTQTYPELRTRGNAVAFMEKHHRLRSAWHKAANEMCMITAIQNQSLAASLLQLYYERARANLEKWWKDRCEAESWLTWNELVAALRNVYTNCQIRLGQDYYRLRQQFDVTRRWWSEDDKAAFHTEKEGRS